MENFSFLTLYIILGVAMFISILPEIKLLITRAKTVAVDLQLSPRTMVTWYVVWAFVICVVIWPVVIVMEINNLMKK